MELISRHKRPVQILASILTLALTFWFLTQDTHRSTAHVASVQSAKPTPVLAIPPKHIAKAVPIRHEPGVPRDYIIQASSVVLARQAVERVGGKITGNLEIIRAVGASLDDRQIEALQEKPVDGLHIYED